MAATPRCISFRTAWRIHNTPSFVRKISVFEAANNVGITAFEIRSIPSTPLGYEAYLEVQNFGQPAEVGVTLSGTGGQRVNRTVRLGTGETFKDVFDLSEFAGGGVRAAVQTKDDALPLDDVAFAYLPIKRKTRTLLVTKGNHFLETALKLEQLRRADGDRSGEFPRIAEYRRVHLRSLCPGHGSFASGADYRYAERSMAETGIG